VVWIVQNAQSYNRCFIRLLAWPAVCSSISSRIPTKFIVDIALLLAGMCGATNFQTVIEWKIFFRESAFDIRVLLTIEEYGT